MNKNKFSQFLLSASAGVVITFSVSEIQARATVADADAAEAIQAERNSAHIEAVTQHLVDTEGLSKAEAATFADAMVRDLHGLKALNLNREKGATRLIKHLKAGVPLTGAVINAFEREIGNAAVLEALGLSDVRQLNSPAIERREVPAQITTIEDAVYFAEQRKSAGEFTKAAEFFEKARELAPATDAEQRTKFGEEAMLMYLEYFIHHVERASSVTAKGVSDAIELSAKVNALANSIGTEVAYRRAAHAATALGTAIHDLILLEKKAKAAIDPLQVDAITAASEKIARMYIDLYRADISARDMFKKAASTVTGDAANKNMVDDANAMRLAIGALADAVAQAPTMKFSATDAASVTVQSKLKAEAEAFMARYASYDWGTGGVVTEKVARIARQASVMKSQLKAIYNAISSFAAGADRTALREKYDALTTAFNALRDTATTGLTAIHGASSEADKAEYAADHAVVLEVKAEFLYRDLLLIDATEAANLGDGNAIDAAVIALRAYVADGGDTGAASVLAELNEKIRKTSSVADLQRYRNIKASVNRSLALERALVAKAYAYQLEKDIDLARAAQATRLESFLEYARLASNKAAWDSGIVAMDAVLAIDAVDEPAVGAAGDESRLVNVLAKAAKSEALLAHNKPADDTAVAALSDAGVFNAGLLFDADATATAMDNANRALRVRARKALRVAFERAVELHNNTDVKHAVRPTWYALENAYAVDLQATADAAVVAAVGNSTLQELNGDTWAAILEAFHDGADAAAVRAAIRTAVLTNAGVITAAADNADSRRAEVDAAGADNTLAKYFNSIDWDTPAGPGGAAAVLAADHAWGTVEGLYADLKAEYDRITGLAAMPYVQYADASDAWKTAAAASAAWAAEESAKLSGVADDDFEAARDAIGAAYTAAANYESSYALAMVAAGGQGVMVANLPALVAAVEAANGRLAASYVTEDLLDVVRMRAVHLRASADAYNLSRGDEVAANGDARDAAIANATFSGANLGAYQVFVNLVKAALEGTTTYNAAVGLTTVSGDAFRRVQQAYTAVNAKWLPSLASTIALTEADAPNAAGNITDSITALLSTSGVGGVAAAVAAGDTVAGRAFDMGALLDPAGNYTNERFIRRDIGLVYETVMRTLNTLGVGTVQVQAQVDARLGFVYAAAVAQSTAAEAAGVADVLPNTDAMIDQLNRNILILTQIADASEAAAAGAYAATLSNTASADANVTLRGNAIDNELRRIREDQARDAYAAAMAASGADATTVLKASAARAYARMLDASGKAHAQLHANVSSSAHQIEARDYYMQAAAAYEVEIQNLLQSENANTALVAAYKNLERVLKAAVALGAASDENNAKANQAKLDRARLLYREGDMETSAALLDELMGVSSNDLMHEILDELAAQYESAGMLTRASKTYAQASEQATALGRAKDAFSMAKRAYNAASQTGSEEAYAAVVEAFNMIGARSSFHGHVRAEAYNEAARASVDAGLFEGASVAYDKSAQMWAKVGDHRQAGNQYEKAGWALGKVAAITTKQRVKIIGYVASGATQLQKAEATHRLEKMVALAELHIAELQKGSDDISVADYRAGMVAAAEVMYQKALAFARDQKMEHADAAEARIKEFLKAVNAGLEAAKINNQLAKLYVLQGKNVEATNLYIDVAKVFAGNNMLLEAAKAYNAAAGTASDSRQGSRIQAEIITPMMALSASVRGAAHASKGTSLQHQIHIEVLEALYAYAAVYPSDAIATAEAELVVVKGEALGRSADQAARIHAIELGLLRLQGQTLSSTGSDDAEAATLLTRAEAAFEALKGLKGQNKSETFEINKYLARGASELADMYNEQNILSDVDAIAENMAKIKGVLEAGKAAALAASASAVERNTGYAGALAAIKQAAAGYTEAVRNFATVFSSTGGELPSAHLDYMLSVAHGLVDFGKEATRCVLLGVLTEREEAQTMKVDYNATMSSLHSVNASIKAMRSISAAHRAAEKAAADAAKAAMEKTEANVAGVLNTVETSVKAAQAIEAPAERAEQVQAAVSTHVNTIVDHVAAGLAANATVATKAAVPAPVVNAETGETTLSPESAANEKAMADHAEAILASVDVASKKLADVQAAPTSTAQAVVPANKR